MILPPGISHLSWNPFEACGDLYKKEILIRTIFNKYFEPDLQRDVIHVLILITYISISLW